MSLWLILIQAGLSIAKQHGLSGDAADTGGFLLDAARAVDELYEKEVGTPLDWSSLRHHEHLPPAGEPPTDPGPLPEDPNPDPPDES